MTIHGLADLPGAGSPVAVGLCMLKGLSYQGTPLARYRFEAQNYLRNFLRQLVDTSRVTIPFFEGHIFEPFTGPESFVRVRRGLYGGRYGGFNQSLLRSKKELGYRSWPVSMDHWRGAYSFPKDFWLCPQAYLKALEAASRTHGAAFSEGMIDTIEPQPAGLLRLRCSEGQHFDAKQVVLAAGAFTDQILAASGLKTLGLWPVAGVTKRSKIASLGDDPNPAVPSVAIVKKKLNLVIHHPMAIYGSSNQDLDLPSQCVPKNIPEPSPIFFEQELAKCPVLYQKMFNFSSAEHLVGMRARVKDRRPVIGWYPHLPDHQLLLATCFHRIGLQLSALTGENIAKWLLSGRPQTDLSTFYPQRLAL